MLFAAPLADEMAVGSTFPTDAVVAPGRLAVAVLGWLELIELIELLVCHGRWQVGVCDHVGRLGVAHAWMRWVVLLAAWLILIPR